jgi:hypothetical protein
MVRASVFALLLMCLPAEAAADAMRFDVICQGRGRIVSDPHPLSHGHIPPVCGGPQPAT